MRIIRSATNVLAVIASLAAFAPRSAAAQEDFYKGKTVELVISTGVGGGLDLNARTLAPYLSKHIPGQPTIVPKNMPGGGHIRAANYVFNQAPKDGTTIATFIPVFVMSQLLHRSKNIQFDAAKFNWLGSTASSNSTLYVWHTSGIKTLADAKKQQVVMGGTGVGSYTVIYPLVMNSVLGTKFKIVTGYKSTAQIGLAMERGEIQGRAGNNFNSLKAEHADWLKTGKINILVQIGLEKDPEFANVPLLLDQAEDKDDRQVLKFVSTDVVIGRPFLTAPGVPAERVAILRKAFDAAMKDPAYQADAKKAGLEVEPVSGAKIQNVVADFVATPANIIAKAKAAMEPKGITERKK
jgi:tripartite-type tricarboxylate transporter receptor subunit TctC